MKIFKKVLAFGVTRAGDPRAWPGWRPPEGGGIVEKRRQSVGNEEIAFAHEQKQNAHEEIAFADEQKRNAHKQIAFADKQKRNAHEQIAFPDEQSEMLTSKSLFLTSKSEMLARKSLFLIADVGPRKNRAMACSVSHTADHPGKTRRHPDDGRVLFRPVMAAG